MTPRKLVWHILLTHAAYCSAVDYSADLDTAKSQATSIYNNTKTFQQQEFGKIDTSMVSGMAAPGFTPETHAAANVEKVTACKAAADKNYLGMTDQQKTECIAIITAAGNLFSPNPYLDPAKPSNQSMLTSMRNADIQQQGVADVSFSSNGLITPPISSNSSCTPITTVLPPVTVSDRCHIEKPVIPQTCDIPISIAIKDGNASSSENSAACATYSSNPYCEVGDKVCTQTADIEIGTDAEGKSITTTMCVKMQQGYGCWQPNSAWNDSGCNRLTNNANCSITGSVATKSIGGTTVWQDNLYSCGGCQKFCVNGHKAGNCRLRRRSCNDRKQRTTGQPAG